MASLKTPNRPGIRNTATAKERLSKLGALDVASELAQLEPPERFDLFRLLEKRHALKVFQLLDVAHQKELLDFLGEDEAAYLLEEMDPDDRVRLLGELPEPDRENALARLSPRERSLTGRLLRFPPESAGRIMSPEYVDLDPDMTVDEALARIRQQGKQAETIHTLPVTDESNLLLGMVDLSDLILAAGDRTVAQVMDDEYHRVRSDEDQEVVGRLLQAADLLAIPVVDDGGRLLGLVTVDDAMDVLSQEEEEDIARAGGSEPLRRPYFSVSDFRLARSRIIWLLVLVVAASLTVQVLNLFEKALEEVVTLALFIPLLIGTAGNTGAQSSTTIVRGMAMGDIHPGNFLRIVFREARIGLLLGTMLGLASFPCVWLFADQSLALVIFLTLIAICTLASVVGSTMPQLAQLLGVDPAVASAPFVTTVVDTTGLLVYFLIARTVLNL